MQICNFDIFEIVQFGKMNLRMLYWGFNRLL
jgi:hypothetical protein